MINKTNKNLSKEIIKYNRDTLIIWALLILIILIIPVALAQEATFFTSSYGNSFSSSRVQFYQPSFQTYYGSRYREYWPVIDDPEQCFARQDFIVQIAPAGCQPPVVRSDLLEEQNVPVFCQLDAIKLNPLIDIKAIDTISFTGQYPPGIAGIGFHPARAALRTRDRLLGSPVLNNIGYVVILLKGGMPERDMPEFISGNLTAFIRYDLENSMGIGRAEFYLPLLSDEEWENKYKQYGFWNGKGYVRLDALSGDKARVSIYTDASHKVTSQTLQKGRTSGDIYLPGYYCMAGLELVLDGMVVPEDKAIIYIDDDLYEVYEGSRFFNDACRINNIQINKVKQKDTDEGTNNNGDNNENNNENGEKEIIEKSVDVTCSGARFTLKLKSGDEKNKDYGDQYFRENFENAIKYYREVAEKYGAEKANELDEETLGEKALKAAIMLAANTGQQATQIELIKEFNNKYLDSSLGVDIESLQNVDASEASGYFEVDQEAHFIRLSDVEEPNKEESGVVLMIRTDGEESEVVKQKNEYIEGKEGSEKYIRIRDYEEDEVLFSYYCNNDEDNALERGNEKISKGKSEIICGKHVYVKDIRWNAMARVKIIPKTKNTQTTANFSFNIGIEKRAIQLSPDKTREMIENLDENIKRWEKINKRLGKTVETLKGACFATSTFLTIKNLFNNFGGKSIARQEVMRRDGGWTDRCKKLIADGKYQTYAQCYLDNAEDIEKEVNIFYDALKEQQDKLSILDKKHTEKTSLFGSSVDTEKFNEEYFDGFGKKIENMISNDISNIKVGEEEKQISEFTKLLTNENQKNGYFTTQDAREIEYLSMLLNKEGLTSETKDSIKTELQEKLKSVYKYNKDKEEEDSLENELENRGFKDITVVIGGKKGSIYGEYGGGKTIKQIGDIDEGSYVQGLIFENEKYILKLNKALNNEYTIEKICDTDGREINDENIINNIKGRYKGFIKYDEGLYQNPYKVKPEIRFFETEPYRGKAEYVPFDLKNGWYVKTKQTLPSFGGIGAYQASGMPSSLWLCNIGPDGEEDDISEDICQQINVNTGQPLNVFAGLSSEKAERLTRAAMDALTQANRQYGSKGKEIKISVGYGIYSFKQGDPAVAIPSAQCQDFMSPKDCYLLFNLCDPVLCPSSRCNLGGKYPVDNVIQQGIVGGLFLCLPNIREKIWIPLCLTGIHAGIDNYVSILKASRDCLQESLETGRNIGICDEMTSIYMCEFFWRQIAPVANILLPKLVEYAMGQGTRGGGEYLTVQEAWDNAAKTVDYLTNVYAVNAVEAYKIRSTEEIGTEVCKAFISTRYPSSFETLIEPDSPTQFYARFDEIPFTDATLPASSQYKVYYHIFAGNDQGVYYSVYLKNPPELSYYSQTAQVVVDTGYVPRGQFIDLTRDFTAPAGYKELCVMINAKEECGFKQVSTSFALNYARDLYVSEQASQQDIRSEKECVSGIPSLLAAAQPSAEGASEGAIPAIYKRGIIRICATNNPGEGTEPERWKDVGYCDDKKIRCWLDKKSVENAITDENVGILNATLAEIEESVEKVEEAGFESVEGEIEVVDTNIASLQNNIAIDSTTINEIKIQAGEVISYINKLLQKNLMNRDRATLISKKAQVYDEVARAIFKKSIQHKLEKEKEAGGEEAEGEKTEEPKIEGVAEEVKKCDDLESCRKLVGQKIIEIVETEKDNLGINNIDKTVEESNVANSFECLVLQVAMQESHIQHCGTILDQNFEENGNPFYCDGILEKVLSGAANEYGVMQINIKAHSSMRDKVANFEENVKYAINFLATQYKASLNLANGRFYEPTDTRYTGWKFALRSYNGWGTNGEPDYVEKVINQKEESIGNLFSQCS